MEKIKLYNAITKVDGDLLDRSLRNARISKPKAVWLRVAALGARLVLAVSVSAVALLLCKPDDPLPDFPSHDVQSKAAEFEWAGWTLEQYIDASSCVFYGKCTNITHNNTITTELSFDVERVYKGEYDPQIGTFASLLSKPFVVGRSYLIFCGLDASVFSGKDVYGISSVVCDTDGGLYHEGVFGLKQTNLSEVCSYTEAYLAEHPSDNIVPIQNDYCRSDDFKDIYDYASTVMVAKITGIINNTNADRTMYSFEAKDILKGGVNGEQWITAFKDAMNVGEEYLLLLGKPNESAVFFTVCSPKSIVPANSETAEYIYSIK